MSFIEVDNLRKVYRIGNEKVIALDSISLKIEKGEICCILGTSGSGKSTFLNMLAGLEKATKGTVKINGREVTSMTEKELAEFRQETTGFIFQSYNLLASMNAVENVAMPLMFKGVHPLIRNNRAKKMLRAVGLEKRLYHKPTQMSGGQQQRVGIARALISKPPVVFADEPTGNLDTKTTAEVMEIVVKMCRKHNLTLILVTHDNDIAKYADRIVHIVDGKIESDYPNVSIVPSEEKKLTETEKILENLNKINDTEENKNENQ